MRFRLLLFFLLILSFYIFPQDSDKHRLYKSLDDDATKYTNVGNFGLTITNFGTYGHGFVFWPQQPSAEYPIGSGIEHLFDGGLWIGAFTQNDTLGGGRQGPFVTTAAVDAASVSARGGGFEFTNAPGARVTERSSKFDSNVYSPDAVSHQDLVMVYSDTSRFFLNGELIVDHTPIGVEIYQESYAWDLSFANNFIIMNY